MPFPEPTSECEGRAKVEADLGFIYKSSHMIKLSHQASFKTNRLENVCHFNLDGRNWLIDTFPYLSVLSVNLKLDLYK